MPSDWCKLFRKAEYSEVFRDDALWRVWTWCLMRANHKRTRVTMKVGRGTTSLTLEPGQFVTGRRAASKALGMAESSVLDRFRKLERLGQIALKPDNNFTIVTLVNYGRYNERTEDVRQRSDNDPTQTRINTSLDLIGNSSSLSYSVPEGGVSDGSQEARGASRILIPIPRSLDVPEFVEAFESWKRHLWTLTNGRLSHATLAEHLAKFDAWGISSSIAAIRFTIGKATWREPSLPPTQAAAASQPKNVRPMTASQRNAEIRRQMEESDRLASRGAQ